MDRATATDEPWDENVTWKKTTDCKRSSDSRTSNYTQASLSDKLTIRFIDNVSSLNKVSQQTKRTHRFLDLCSPTFLKGKLPPRSIKEGRKVAKSKKTANGVLSDVDTRLYQAILYFQNVASCDGSPLNLSSFWAKRKVVCSVWWFLRDLQWLKKHYVQVSFTKFQKIPQ
jgi:hypothetical protein